MNDIELKIGDTIVIRDYDDLMFEFPVDNYGNLIITWEYFTEDMKSFCGKSFKILNIITEDKNFMYQLKNKNGAYWFNKNMIRNCTRSDAESLDKLKTSSSYNEELL